MEFELKPSDPSFEHEQPDEKDETPAPVDLREYHYKPINERQIRIFNLFPAAPGSGNRLAGSLSAEKRPEPQYDEEDELVRGTGSYEAISYAWGSDENPYTVSIDGCILRVGFNLYEALLRMRLPDLPRRLWIDAICINQSDNVEKTGQVNAMWQIYADARIVLIWLGEDSAMKEGRKVFAFSRWLTTQNLGDSAGMLYNIWEDSDDTMARFNASTPPDHPSIGLEDVNTLYSRPWFRRMWVIQEFAVAADVIMYCGQCCIDLQAIFWLFRLPNFVADVRALAACRNLSRSKGGQGTFYEMTVEFEKPRKRNAALTFALSGRDCSRSKEVQRSAVTNFHDLVSLSTESGFQCKDPRDRIAALNFFFHTNKPNGCDAFSVDYTETEEQNYIRFAKYILGHDLCRDEETMQFLWHAANKRPHDSNHVLPSWVPDWRVEWFIGMQSESKNVDVLLLMASKCEVRQEANDAICLRLQVLGNPRTVMAEVETMFTQRVCDSWCNGHRAFSDDGYLLQQGDLVCYVADDDQFRDAHILFLRRSRTNDNSWVLKKHGVRIAHSEDGDECLVQVRQHMQSLKTPVNTMTVELTVV